MKPITEICDGRTLQDIQTDTAKAVDVGMVDLCQEADLRRSHRVIIGEEELKPEDATCSILCWSLKTKQRTAVLSSIPSYGDCAGP